MVLRDTTADDLLGQAAADFRYDPLGFVMFWFPWDTDQTIQQVPGVARSTVSASLWPALAPIFGRATS